MRYSVRMMVRGLLISATLFAAVTFVQGDAFAQAAKKGRRKVVIIPGVRIEGRIQKPQAFYILQRSNLNFEGLELKNSFVPKIIKSVDQAPF